MSGELQQPPNLAEQIFESHFSSTLDPKNYERAKAIFDQVGAFNERSIAIQIYTATHAGKLEEVLRAYEELIAPTSELLATDLITRAAYIRRFADYIYGGVIIEEGSDPMDLLKLRKGMEIPKIFDLMS